MIDISTPRISDHLSLPLITTSLSSSSFSSSSPSLSPSPSLSTPSLPCSSTPSLSQQPYTQNLSLVNTTSIPSMNNQSGSRFDYLVEELKEMQSFKDIVLNDTQLESIEYELQLWINGAHTQFSKQIEKLKYYRDCRLESARWLLTCQESHIDNLYSTEQALIFNDFKKSLSLFKRGLIENIYTKQFKEISSSFTSLPKDTSLTNQSSQIISYVPFCSMDHEADTESENSIDIDDLEMSELKYESPEQVALNDLKLINQIKRLENSRHIKDKQKYLKMSFSRSNRKDHHFKIMKSYNFLPSPSHSNESQPYLEDPIDIKGQNHADTVHVMSRQGRLRCDGRWFEPGDPVIVTNKKGSKTFGSIESVNGTEVWINKSDGTTKRVYLTHLRKRKYQLTGRSTNYE